jgi:hypothetical protein
MMGFGVFNFIISGVSYKPCVFGANHYGCKTAQVPGHGQVLVFTVVTEILALKKVGLFQILF